jgi:hypothetical protein
MLKRLVTLAVAVLLIAGPAAAWDSSKFSWVAKIIHPTHSYFTEYAIDNLRGEYPELETYREVLIDGANLELHELPVNGVLYGVNLDAKRLEHKGTNAGSDDVPGWWKDARKAYAAGKKEAAWLMVGIMLHMIQDMGVPAHANGVYHQGTLTEFDNFEAMAAQKWDPDFATVDRKDPGYSDPSRYYAFSRQWTHADAPNYLDRDEFSKTWPTASDDEKWLMRKRQASTARLTLWALRAAAKALK